MRSTINSFFSFNGVLQYRKKASLFRGKWSICHTIQESHGTVSPLSSVYRMWTGAKMQCEALELAIT